MHLVGPLSEVKQTKFVTKLTFGFEFPLCARREVPSRPLCLLDDAVDRLVRFVGRADIAIFLSDCPTRDLHGFFEEGGRARSFPRYFWWVVKGGKG